MADQMILTDDRRSTIYYLPVRLHRITTATRGDRGSAHHVRVES
ncbi:MAG: hypothetical protein R2697_19235 [Ilumatobacteraceae bacterium]